MRCIPVRVVISKNLQPVGHPLVVVVEPEQLKARRFMRMAVFVSLTQAFSRVETASTDRFVSSDIDVDGVETLRHLGRSATTSLVWGPWLPH